MGRLPIEMLRDIENRPPIEQEAMLLTLHAEGERKWGPSPPIVSVSRVIEAGCLIRGQLRRTVRSFLDLHGLDYDWKEHGGLLFTSIVLTIRTPTWEDLKQTAILLRAMRQTWSQ